MSGYDRWRDPAEPSWMVEPTREWHPQFPGQRYPGDIGIQQVPFRGDRNRGTATGRAEVVPLVPLDQDGRYRRPPLWDDHGDPDGQGWHGRRDEHRVDDPYARPPAGWPPPPERHPAEPPANRGWRTDPPADPPRADVRHQSPGWTVDRERPREPDRTVGWHGDRPHHGPDGWATSARDVRPHPPVSPAPRHEPGWLPEPGEHPPYGARRHDASDHLVPGYDRPDGGADGHRDGGNARRAPERGAFRPSVDPPEPPAGTTSAWPDRPASGPDRRWSGERDGSRAHQQRSPEDGHARPQWSRDDTRAYPRQPAGRDEPSARPPWSAGRPEPAPRTPDWPRGDDETTQAWSYPGRPGVPEAARSQPQDAPGHTRPGDVPEDARPWSAPEAAHPPSRTAPEDASRPWIAPDDTGSRGWGTRPAEPTPTHREWSPEVEDTARIVSARSAAQDEKRVPDEDRLTAEDLRPVTSPPVAPPATTPTVPPAPSPVSDEAPPPVAGSAAAVPVHGGPPFPPAAAPPLGGLRLEFLPSPGAGRATGPAPEDDHHEPEPARPTSVAEGTSHAEAVPGHDRPAPDTGDVVPGTPTDQTTDAPDGRVDVDAPDGRVDADAPDGGVDAPDGRADADVSERTGSGVPPDDARPEDDTAEATDDRPGTPGPATATDEPMPETAVVEPTTDTVDTRPEPDRPEPVGTAGLATPDGDTDGAIRDVPDAGPDDGGDTGHEFTRSLGHERGPDGVSAQPRQIADREPSDGPRQAAGHGHVDPTGTPDDGAVAPAAPEPAGAAAPVAYAADGVGPVPPVAPVSAPPAPPTLISDPSDPVVPDSAGPAPAPPTDDAPVSAPPADDAPVSAPPAGDAPVSAPPVHPDQPVTGTEPTGDLDEAAAVPVESSGAATSAPTEEATPEPQPEAAADASTPDEAEPEASTEDSPPPATATAVPVSSPGMPVSGDRATDQAVEDRPVGVAQAPTGWSAPAVTPSHPVPPSGGPVPTSAAPPPSDPSRPDTSPSAPPVAAELQGADAWFRPKQPVRPTSPSVPEPDGRGPVPGPQPVSAPPARPVSPAPGRPISAPTAQPDSAPPARPVSGPPHRPVSAPSGQSLFTPSPGRVWGG
ncbi:hypothetical protein ACFFR1_10810, partial [Micromonospora sagamiensis]